VESYCLPLAHRNETCENPPIVENSKIILEDHADRIGKIIPRGMYSNQRKRNLIRGIVVLEAILRLETRNLTGPRCENDSSHGVEISIFVVVGVTGVVRKYSFFFFFFFFFFVKNFLYYATLLLA